MTKMERIEYLKAELSETRNRLKMARNLVEEDFLSSYIGQLLNKIEYLENS